MRGIWFHVFSTPMTPTALSRTRPRVFLTTLLCVLAPTLGCVAGIDLGGAGAYTVFGLGSTQSVGSADSVTLNTAEIYGNVAVGADTSSGTASGNGSFQKGFIQGNLFIDGATTAASYTIVNKNFTVSGTVFGTVPANPGPNPDSTGTGTFNLAPAVQDAIDRSAFYNSLPGQVALGNFSLNSANTTLLAGTYSATGFSMNSGSILTISGGPNDTFVLNDSGDFSFAKSFIVLVGGITADNVLFNITGTGTTVTVSGSNSIFYGTVLAVSRNISIDGIGTGSPQGVSLGPDGLAGTADDNPGFDGRVIGSLSTSATVLNLGISGGAEINAVPEPTSIALFGTGLTALTLFLRRRLIK
jgi:PEP-CTERM motif